MHNLNLAPDNPAVPAAAPFAGRAADGPPDFSIRLYWELSDAQLAEIYQTARRENVLDLVAFDALVNEECFLIFARRVEVFGTVYEAGNRPLGFFYLTGFEGATARIHFCLFRAGRPHRRALGRLVLDWCFDVFEFKALIGVVPSINAGAAAFARKMGGRETGRIPGFCWIDRLKRTVGGIQFIFERSRNHGRNVQ